MESKVTTYLDVKLGWSPLMCGERLFKGALQERVLTPGNKFVFWHPQFPRLKVSWFFWNVLLRLWLTQAWGVLKFVLQHKRHQWIPYNFQAIKYLSKEAEEEVIKHHHAEHKNSSAHESTVTYKLFSLQLPSF